MSSRKAQKSKSNLSGGKSGKGKASDATDSVKVAVRVRPFNSREKAGNQECIVEMNGTTTIIKDQSGNKPVRNFTFDYSYWSHDGYEEKEDGVYQGTTDKYASQRKVFDDLGQGMLDNAWNGYNAALFAYGQTGSGKSYTMVGYNQNKGIVPMMCEELFRRIESEKSSTTEFQITFSMLEIYNEKVRDLLARKNVPGGLKIRQNKKDGFFVFGLTKNAVSSAEDALKWMEQGAYARTTAATAMNETSSRSHMVITLAVKQVRNKGSSDSTTVTSDIHMVDLAGSERAESAGTSTDRLQEGSAINQSLSCLGNVISALADLSAGRPNVRVPYRDSVLTKLLQNALGGNSRTIMISAISPSQMNYEETISTLRYADRAKQIKCKAVINENPTEKLIRELKEENARLMEMLSQGTLPSGKGQDAHKDLIEENKLRLQHMDMNWADQLAKAESSRSPGPGRYHRSKSEKDCHLVNINEDPLLSGVIRHVIKEGKTLIGREDDGHEAVPSGYENCTRLGGLSILAEHAKLTRSGNTVTLEPMANAQVIVNGKRLLKITTLQHHDRIVLAPNHLYKYVAHREQRKKDKRTIDFNFVQLEIAAAQGLTSLAGVGTSTCLVNPDLQQVRQDLIELLPMVAEANAISKELEKNVVFDVIVKNGASHNLTDKSKSVMVKVTDRNTNYVWLWEKSTFINRKYLMQELYELWVDGETLDQDQSKDPFWDPPEDMFLGSVYIYLQSLAYQFDIEETMSITNYKGEDEGKLHVGISPCDCTGLANSEKDTPPMFVDNPQQQLLGSRMDLLVKIPYARNIRWIQEDPSRGISCQFKFYTDTKMRTTKTVLHEDNPNFDYTKQFTIKSVSHNFLNYLEHNALVVEVWGKQGNGRPKGGGIPMSLGSGSKVDDASMDNVLSETQWRTERIQLLQQLSDLTKEVEFLKIEKGVLEKEMTRITLASETFMQEAEGLLPGEGPGQDLPSMVQGFLKEDHVLRERLDELSSGQYRPSKSELKSVKQACDNQQKEVGRIEKELSSIVKAARAVTDAVAKKPAK